MPVGAERSPESHAAPVSPSVAGPVPLGGRDAPRAAPHERETVWLAGGAVLVVAVALAAARGRGTADNSAPALAFSACLEPGDPWRLPPIRPPRHGGCWSWRSRTPPATPRSRPWGGWPRSRVAQGLAESGQVEVLAGSGRPVDAGEAGLRAAAAETGGHGTVVSGAYYLEGDSVRLQARVTDPRRAGR